MWDSGERESHGFTDDDMEMLRQISVEELAIIARETDDIVLMAACSTAMIGRTGQQVLDLDLLPPVVANDAPTMKQLDYLRILGYKGRPESKRHAGRLIYEIKQKKGIGSR